MVNTLLVALAGKTSGFKYEALNVHQHFVPDYDTEEVRSILIQGSDCKAVYLCQAALYDPYVALLLPEGLWSSDLTNIALIAHDVEGGELVADEHGPAYISTAAGSVAMEDDVVVRYATPDSVFIEHGTAITTVPVTIVEDEVVSLDWPEGFGISGNIALDAPYGPATVVRITGGGKYPYGEVCTLLEASASFFDLLLATGLVDAYYFADNDRYKISIAVLAVCRSFLSKQAGN